MEEINVNTSKKYSIYFSTKWSYLSAVLDNHNIGNIYVITDKNVYKKYDDFFRFFNERIDGVTIIEPGENSKNLQTIQKIYNDMMKSKCTRKTVIAAVGGGVVGDLSGFAASTYMRGIKLINIPTTLMAQCDSSIGGKNGFNYNECKNTIGTIYQPEFVYVNTDFLNTLSIHEFKNGLVELIKCGFVCNKDLFSYIEENKSKISKRSKNEMEYIIHESIISKADIVEFDEFDMGRRHILNFGHTIAHGIESASNFNISHGYAVAVGMMIESLIANKLGFLNNDDLKRLEKIIEYFDYPKFYRMLDINKIVKAMENDKKNTSSHIKIVMMNGIGDANESIDIERKTIYDVLTEWMEEKIWQ